MNKVNDLLKIILLVTIMTIHAHVANAQTGWQHSATQSLIEALKIKEPLTFCNESVPLKEADVKERLERELLLSLDDNAEVILWLKRANRYFPDIEKALRDSSLPDDLKYIVVAESALKPLVTSSKGAVGFWQFVEGTGNRYGMKINDHIDERRNVFIATDAAIKYFKDLYALLDSWTLAAAAYNMGEEGLRAEMLLQKENNYYRLYLNEETQRYIFRILAAKIILSNPKKYGFALAEEDLYKPIQFDRVEIEVDNPLPISVLAQAANTYFRVIKTLNPQLKNYYLYAGKYTISIPKGASDGFYQRYENLLKQWHDDKTKAVYTVKKGENLSTIARHFNVPVKAILIWSGIEDTKKVKAGTKLIIFSNVNSSNHVLNND